MNNESSKEPEKISRQNFLGKVAGGIGVCYAAALGYPVYRYLNSPIEKGAGAKPVNEVALENVQVSPGSFKMFKFGSLPAMLKLWREKTRQNSSKIVT